VAVIGSEVEFGFGFLHEFAKRREEGCRGRSLGGEVLELAKDPYPLFLDDVEPNPVGVWLADASSVRGWAGSKRASTAPAEAMRQAASFARLRGNGDAGRTASPLRREPLHLRGRLRVRR